MANNVIQLAFGGETSVTSEELVYKYDYGQMIQFTDIELPEYFEVHFANSKTGRATTQIGYNNIVEIPNTYLSKGSVFGWVFLHDTESDGETEYEFKIPVKNRAVVRDAVTPEQESVITRAIAALNATQAEVQILHDETDEYKDAAEEASTSAITAQGLAEDAQTAAETAQSLAEAAQTAAETAQGLAEAAQTASETAQTAAETAQGLAEDARDEAVEAKDLVLGMSATAVTLDPDEPATADYEDGLLTLGIPQGETGATPNLTIGTVTTLEPDEDATATISGTAENPILSFGIPKGDTGEVSLQELEDATVVQTLSDNEPYHFRRTNNGNGAGVREYDEIVGASVGWNQLVQNGDFENTSHWASYYGATFTAQDNVATIVGNGNASGSRIFQDMPRTPSHKYFVAVAVKTDGVVGATITTDNLGSVSTNISPTTSWTNVYRIADSGSYANANIRFHIRVWNSQEGTVYAKNAQLVDLTLFNTQIADYVYSLEQSTAGSGVTWLKSHFPKLFDNGYQPFDSGSIKSVSGLTAHEMVGFNQLPIIPAYTNSAISFDKSKCVRLISGYQYQYTFSELSNATSWRTMFTVFDLDGNKIEGADSYTTIVSAGVFSDCDSTMYFDTTRKGFRFGSNATAKSITFTTAKDCYLHISFTLGDTSASSVMSEPCLHFGGSRDGEYEPYIKHTYPLDSSVTLRGQYKLNNGQLYAVGDVWKSSGNVEWSWMEYTFDGTETFGVTVLDGYSQVSWNGFINIGKANAVFVTNRFVQPANNVGGLGLIWNSSVPRLFMGLPTSVTTNAEAKAWFIANPTTVVFEVATPTTETATPYTNPQWCDSKGTEEYVGSELPCGHSTDYPMSLVDTMPKDDGSYTIQVDVANGKPSVSWVMPASVSMIAPTEASYVATRNYTSGSLLIVNGTLYKATANIANGGNIVPGTNCVATTLAEVISALA